MTCQLIKLTSVHKSFGSRPLFCDLSLSINRGDRMALIGANGCGKSTLARMMAGLEPADSGSVLFADSDICYLPQEVDCSLTISVDGYLQSIYGDLLRIQKQMCELEVIMASDSPHNLEAMLERYGALQDLFQRRGGYDLDHRFDRILTGLELTYITRDRPMVSLSGGEQRRVALAALLLRSPDLLILDEPTNHLDSKALTWLEEYLRSYQNALLIISHERDFINRTTNGILEISKEQTLTYFSGSYDDFVIERDRRYEEQEKAYEEYKSELKELYGWLKKQTYGLASPVASKDSNKMAYDRHGESVAKMHARRIAQTKVRLEELERNVVERPARRSWASMNFQASDLVSERVIEVEGVSKSYGNTPLFHNLSISVKKGDRIAIKGANGTGKSTLAKIICGLEAPDSGNVRIAPKARVVYLEQDWQSLIVTNTVLEEYRSVRGCVEDNELRAELHKYGLFVGQEVYQQVQSLSSGMKQRLKLAKALARKPDVLILDEPTNHLDLASVENLERALKAFAGTLIFISHDRRLVQALATGLVVFDL
ncbi:MAG: ABC-F family ATP-binding cassette domain-containing protein [Chlamydiales bacterium]|nr:ABC-F family ATP-binding cassette domain-containing protein [Chlamydiales bacterium]